jgi:large subunit ribosomal protein L29
MKLDEIRALSDAELRARVTELQEEQFRLRFRSATETLESPLRLREVRRDIARVLTILREKELAAAPKGTTKGARKGARKGSGNTARKSAAKTVRTKSAR